jgi:hypothetical protein
LPLLLPDTIACKLVYLAVVWRMMDIAKPGRYAIS